MHNTKKVVRNVCVNDGPAVAHGGQPLEVTDDDIISLGLDGAPGAWLPMLFPVKREAVEDTLTWGAEAGGAANAHVCRVDGGAGHARRVHARLHIHRWHQRLEKAGDTCACRCSWIVLTVGAKVRELGDCLGED